MSESEYVRGLQLDADAASRAQEKFFRQKSEQQKVLEEILSRRFRPDQPFRVADVACGNGHLSYHLSELFPQATFSLVDLNELLLDEARQLLGESSRFEYRLADIHDLPDHWAGAYDCVVCWQTLSWLEDYRLPVSQMVKLLKPGGVFCASALINLRHDVDILSRVVDHTRPSSASGISYCYNTYSGRQFEAYLRRSGLETAIHPFVIGVDLPEVAAGLGTYTVTTDQGERLQLSGGMLLNWAIVEAVK